MRILYHHRTRGDGAEGVHIAAMVEAFRALGHDVVLHGATPGATPGSPGLLVGARAYLPGVAAEVVALAYNLPEYLMLRGALRRERPDLLYVRHSRGALAPLLAARRAGVPTILEVNALFAAPGYQRFEPLWLPGAAAWSEREAIRRATLVVTVSAPLARGARAAGGRHVISVPNGADAQRFDPARADGAAVRARLGLEGRHVIGWVGILRAWHGLDTLLAALVDLPGSVLMVVGDVPPGAGLRERADALGVAPRLAITGRVPHASMPDYLAAMDVAVVADEQTGVASPMKLLEYMAMARAVVAPRTESIEEVVEDGVDGLLFSQGNAAELTAHLQRLAGDPALREALGARARARIVQRRNWRAIADLVVQEIGRARASGEGGIR